MEIKTLKKLKLYSFNNLTKTLSFNMYDICFAKTPQHRKEYIQYIDAEYNAERLTHILTEVSKIIGANILNIASQDYDPQGSSVTMLISEGKAPEYHPLEMLLADSDSDTESVVCHLDKKPHNCTYISRKPS